MILEHGTERVFEPGRPRGGVHPLQGLEARRPSGSIRLPAGLESRDAGRVGRRRGPGATRCPCDLWGGDARPAPCHLGGARSESSGSDRQDDGQAVHPGGRPVARVASNDRRALNWSLEDSQRPASLVARFLPAVRKISLLRTGGVPERPFSITRCVYAPHSVQSGGQISPTSVGTGSHRLTANPGKSPPPLPRSGST
jgi:hypothetical protein